MPNFGFLRKDIDARLIWEKRPTAGNYLEELSSKLRNNADLRQGIERDDIGGLETLAYARLAPK